MRRRIFISDRAAIEYRIEFYRDEDWRGLFIEFDDGFIEEHNTLKPSINTNFIPLLEFKPIKGDENAPPNTNPPSTEDH